MNDSHKYVFAFEEVGHAIAALPSGRHFGKISVRF